jgi:hypothetical protein
MMHNIVYATLWKLVEKKKKFNGENPLLLRIDEPTLLFVSARMLHRRCQRVEAAENDAIGHGGKTVRHGRSIVDVNVLSRS